MLIKYAKLNRDAKLPEYQTPGSAGADVYACTTTEGINLGPGVTKLIPTGLAVEIPEGYELQVRSRSSLSLRGVVVLNSPGTIDSDYRGEIAVMLHNFSTSGLFISHGDRIAQLVLSKVKKIEWMSDVLSATKRGVGGFGSTD